MLNRYCLVYDNHNKEVNNINRFHAVGTIIKPLKYYDSNGKCFIIFTVSVERDYRSRTNKPIYDYINCKAFGQLATKLNEIVTIGDVLMIDGQIQTRFYKHYEQKKYTTELLVTHVFNLSQIEKSAQSTSIKL
ncbi:single-stranded DNA-binding protein [Staphylococcus felis]|uniref:single-stranded DNA-binding protein n=1 Tax=Staphylococcus felis TaxID=46127 RepID=UPI001EE90C44|nr:single-stranded DNA-binding protein [Staphylococcus felis]